MSLESWPDGAQDCWPMGDRKKQAGRVQDWICLRDKDAPSVSLLLWVWAAQQGEALAVRPGGGQEGSGQGCPFRVGCWAPGEARAPKSLPAPLFAKQNIAKNRRVCCFLAGQQDWAETVSTCDPGSRTELKGPPGARSSILPGFFKPQWATQGGHCLEKTGGRPGHLGPDTVHSPSFPEQS